MKGCIFDIDGTMFLNREFHMLAWKQCLRGPYERPFTEDEFVEHKGFAGEGIKTEGCRVALTKI